MFSHLHFSDNGSEWQSFDEDKSSGNINPIKGHAVEGIENWSSDLTEGHSVGCFRPLLSFWS